MRWSYVTVHRYFVYIKSSKTLKRIHVLDGWSQESREGGKARYTNLCASQSYPELGVLKLTQRHLTVIPHGADPSQLLLIGSVVIELPQNRTHTATGSLDSNLYIGACYLHYLISLILLLSNNWFGPQAQKSCSTFALAYSLNSLASEMTEVLNDPCTLILKFLLF